MRVFKAEMRHATCGDSSAVFKRMDQDHKFNAGIESPDKPTVARDIRTQAAHATDRERRFSQRTFLAAYFIGVNRAVRKFTHAYAFLESVSPGRRHIS